ncbi:MAG: radical SAM protein [Polyangiaceae bacterium]|nr:radical SAM protein [Polyangiaceae bacterium]
MSQAVDAVVRELLGPLLCAQSSGARWRLLSWDVDQGITLTLSRGERLLFVELSPRDDAGPAFARTRRFNLTARPAFTGGAPLSPEERAVVTQLAQLVAAREGALPVVARPAATRQSLVREIEVDRVLVAEGAGHYYINPYVGCMIGCEFCWAATNADLSRALEGLPELAWGRWVDVKVNAPEVLRRELAAHEPGVVRMSPVVTDPYQPLERKYRVTRGCVRELGDAGFSPAILTREARVLEDAPLLARCPGAAVGLSIPTDDDAVREAFEPAASPIEERLGALRGLAAAGLRTFVIVQPVLPMNPARLVEQIAPYVRAVRIDRMHARARSRHLYERAGRLDAMSDEFAAATEAALRDGFRAKGVAVDELDDLAAALAAGDAAPAARGSTSRDG